MLKFLLEILSEEIPAGLQSYAQGRFQELFSKAMKDLKIGKIEVFTSCRRIAVIIEGVDDKLVVARPDKKGPSVGSEAAIVEKFATSAGVSVSQLYTKAIGKKEYYFARLEDKGNSLEDILKQRTEDILNNFSWPRSMRWGNHSLSWIRPIKSIICMLGKKIIPIQFHHYSAGVSTNGPCVDPDLERIEVTSAEDYMSLLAENGVVLSQIERKNLVRQQVAIIETEYNCSVQVTEELLDEVVGITESPNVILGTFNPTFLTLPEGLIKTVIVSHQKVFPVLQNGTLLNKFVAVSSLNSKAPVKGYERVINARLADAASMVAIDTKTPLIELAPKLKQLIFHKKLGNFGEKVQRVRALAKFATFWVPNASIIKVEQTAELAKLDLLTTFVRDFPELAGFVGSYYFELSGEKDVEIINAIRDQYLPVDAADVCPTAPVTVTLALADKMDTLVGLISANEKVTSTRDPLGIRRAAIGILRIIVENNIAVPLKVFLMKAIDLYPPSLFLSLINRIGINSDEEKQRKVDVMIFIQDFFADRLRAMLLKKGVSEGVFQSVADGIEHPLTLSKKCIAIAKWLKQDDGIKFMQLYKRVIGILKTADDFLKAKYNKKVLILPEESALIEGFENFQVGFVHSIKSGEFEKSLLQCGGLVDPLSLFMDNVLVNVEDLELKKNRMGLLLSVAETLDELCHFEILCKHFS